MAKNFEGTLLTMVIAGFIAGGILFLLSQFESSTGKGTQDSTPFTTGFIVGFFTQLAVRLTGIS